MYHQFNPPGGRVKGGVRELLGGKATFYAHVPYFQKTPGLAKPERHFALLIWGMILHFQRFRFHNVAFFLNQPLTELLNPTF
jgi:hypothetical protein